MLIGTFVLFIYHGFQKLISQLKQLVPDNPNKALVEKKEPELGEKEKKKRKKAQDSQSVSILFIGQPVGRCPLKVKALPPIPATSCTESKKTFYAVKVGFQTGVFTTWKEYKRAVKHYPGADFRVFKSRKEAEAWYRS